VNDSACCAEDWFVSASCVCRVLVVNILGNVLPLYNTLSTGHGEESGRSLLGGSRSTASSAGILIIDRQLSASYVPLGV